MTQAFNAKSWLIGVLMSLMSVGTAVTSASMGTFRKYLNEKQMLLLAFIFYSIASLTIPFIENLFILVAPVIIFGVAQGINLPNIFTLLSGLAPISYRAAFMSLNGMVLRLGQTIGPLLMGSIFAIWKLKGVFLSAGILAILMLGILWYVVKPDIARQASN